MNEMTRIESAISFIPAIDRELWVEIGMAVKSDHPARPGAIYRTWSRQAESLPAGRPKPSGGPSSRPDGSRWPLYHHQSAWLARRRHAATAFCAQIAERRQASIEALRRRDKEAEKEHAWPLRSSNAARSVRVGQPSIPRVKGFPDARALVDADGAMLVPMRDCLSGKLFLACRRLP